MQICQLLLQMQMAVGFDKKNLKEALERGLGVCTSRTFRSVSLKCVDRCFSLRVLWERSSRCFDVFIVTHRSAQVETEVKPTLFAVRFARLFCCKRHGWLQHLGNRRFHFNPSTRNTWKVEKQSFEVRLLQRRISSSSST